MALLDGQIQAQMAQQREMDDEKARLDAIDRFWSYYEGRHPLPLTVKTNQPDDNVIVNLCRPIVDKGLSLLFGHEVTWQVDETATDTTPAEEFLDLVWTANDKMVLLHEAGQFGANSGLAAIKVDPQLDDSYDLHALDTRNLRLFCTPGNVKDIWRYRIQFTDVDADGKECCYRQDISRDGAKGTNWTIQNYTAKNNDKTFKADGEPIPWAYPLPPIVHCQNLPCAGSIWGYADLEDTRLQDAINLVTSSTRKILRLHASPQTWIKGMSAAMLRRDANLVWEIDDDAEIGNLEMQTDLDAAHEFYQALRTAFYAQGRMPDASQVANLGALTNFGLRVLFADALERTSTKQMMYGGLIVRLNRLLCLLGKKGDNVITKLTWPDPLPVNKLENVQTVAAELATGLTSNETLSGDLGRDYTDELQRLADEKKARLAAAPKPPPPNGLLPGSTPPDPNAPATPADPNTPTADGRVAPAATVPAGDPAGALKLAQGAKQ